MKKYISYFYTLALSETAKSTYLTTFGAGLNAFLGFIFWIIIARSVSPSDFGLFSVIFNLVTILFVVCDVGISSSVLRFLPQVIRDEKKGEIEKILKVSFLAVLFFSGLLTVALAVFSKPLAVFVFTKRQLSFPLVIASFSLLGLSLSYLFIAILQGKQKFLYGVITESSIAAVKVLATIMLLFLGKLNLISVLVIFSLTSFTGLILGLFFIRPGFLLAKTDMSLIKILFGFGIWVALARIAAAASTKIDTLMLIRFVDSPQVGFYAAAQRMTFIFSVMVTGMTVVFSPKLAALKTVSEAKSFMKKASLLVSTLFLLIIFLFILAPWVTILIYGEAYAPAIFIFRVLLISSTFFVAATVPTITILYFLGESKLFALISILQFILIFFGNLILIPHFGVIGPAISLAIAYGVVFLVSLFIILKKLEGK